MPRSLSVLSVLIAFTLVMGCRVGDSDPDVPNAEVEPAGPPVTATTLGDDRLPSDAEVEAARFRGRGRSETGTDTTGTAAAARSNPETLASVDSTRDWATDMHLPLGGNVAGPSVLKLQVLLDRAGFSPGVIDGRWGDNTELAVSWLQKTEDLEVTGIVNEATLQALAARAGDPDALVVPHRLTEAEVSGPFVEIPEDVYERAEMDRLGFESLGEKLGERFHATPALLTRLNDGVALDSLAAGDTLRVPNVTDAPGIEGQISRLVISGEAGYLHALASNGDILFHAPVTVGASYDPSPEGSFEVESVTRDPWWHYQPSILASVPDDQPEARLPPGPNNAVGSVWIALSKEHYGIHGTSAPETIGYASSAGCVRLTNWDALRLADLVGAGTAVRFRDVAARGDSTSTAQRPTSRS